MSIDPEFLRQYEALTQGVGVAELPRTIVAVTGSDRVQLLQSFTTNDVKKLTVGGGCEAFVTSPQGKTLGHVFIFREANQHTLDAAPGQAQTLIKHFERYVITEEVEFADRDFDVRELLVAGPGAGALLASVGGTQPPGELLAHSAAQIADCPVMVRRVDYAGPVAFFVQTAAADAETVIRALVEAGGIRCEQAAVESARLEAGVPLFGHDITADNLPQEVARDARAISFTKGCYLGQETVARIDALGHVNRLLVGLKFAGQAAPPTGTVLLAGQQDVGHVTSAAWSPRLAAPLALAYVRRSHAKTGSTLSSAAGAAEVIELPVKPPA